MYIMMLNLGKKITLPNPSVPVSKDNAEHRMIYSVSLYNSNDGMRKKFIEDSIALLPPKSGIIKQTEPIDTPIEKKKKFANPMPVSAYSDPCNFTNGKSIYE